MPPVNKQFTTNSYAGWLDNGSTTDPYQFNAAGPWNPQLATNYNAGTDRGQNVLANIINGINPLKVVQSITQKPQMVDASVLNKPKDNTNTYAVIALIIVMMFLVILFLAIKKK